MKQFGLRGMHGVGALALLTGVTAIVVPAAHAQGRGGFRGPQGPATVSRVPLPVLTSVLKLTSDQEAKIKKIVGSTRSQMEALRPAPPADGGRPDPSQMQAMFDKIKAVQDKADADITAVLTQSQKDALPGFLKDATLFQQARIPLELYSTIGLTDDQKKQIADVLKTGTDRESRRANEEKIQAILTDKQKSQIAAYVKAHPRGGGPGGRGGFGGPGGPGGRGGFGGPGGPGGPPPDGGAGAPPPDGGQGAPPPGGPDGPPPTA